MAQQSSGSWSTVLGAAAVLIAGHLALKYLVPLFTAPIPSSLLYSYDIIIAIAIYIYLAADSERWRRFSTPIVRLFVAPETWLARAVVFVLLPLAGGWLVYAWGGGTAQLPAELRTVHPTPPGQITVRGKAFALVGLENPLRKDPAKVPQYIAEGKVLYFQNCFFCHGDNLDGGGHFAQGFIPPPANFVDVGTIAQLQESYVFWRIAKGGPGLPPESHPWSSAMPAWENFLSEEDIWKVIMYIYEGAGHQPRTWEGLH
jgi:mono/diheme cytochrome c family protein